MNDCVQSTERRQEDTGYLRSIIDAFPAYVLIVDDDVRIRDANSAAMRLLGEAPEMVLRHHGGEALHCIHLRTEGAECGKLACCSECVIRQCVKAAAEGTRSVRQTCAMDIDVDGTVAEADFLVTASALPDTAEPLVLLVLEDFSEIFALRRILPICACCHKVRDDKDYWQDVEAYLQKNTKLTFSHGICPQCIEEHYPGLTRRMQARQASGSLV